MTTDTFPQAHQDDFARGSTFREKGVAIEDSIYGARRGNDE